jgi:hypothetical protein
LGRVAVIVTRAGLPEDEALHERVELVVARPPERQRGRGGRGGDSRMRKGEGSTAERGGLERRRKR